MRQFERSGSLPATSAVMATMLLLLGVCRGGPPSQQVSNASAPAELSAGAPDETLLQWASAKAADELARERARRLAKPFRDFSELLDENEDRILRELTLLATRRPEASDSLTSAVLCVAAQYPPPELRRAYLGIEDAELLECWRDFWVGGLPFGTDMSDNMAHHVWLRKEFQRRAERTEDPALKARFLEVAAFISTSEAIFFRLDVSAQQALEMHEQIDALGVPWTNPPTEEDIQLLHEMASDDFSNPRIPPVPWRINRTPRVPTIHGN